MIDGKLLPSKPDYSIDDPVEPCHNNCNTHVEHEQPVPEKKLSIRGSCRSLSLRTSDHGRDVCVTVDLRKIITSPDLAKIQESLLVR